MATLDQIDPFHSLSLSLYRHDPERPISRPVAGIDPVAVSGADVGLFLAWAKMPTWRAALEPDLESVSQDADGNKLLTASLPLVTFRERFCAGGRQLQDDATVALMNRLRSATLDWRFTDGDTVMINGRIGTHAASGGQIVDSWDDADYQAMMIDCDKIMRDKAAITFKILHHYDIGDQAVFIERQQGDVDALRASLYCKFMCEEWFGVPADLSNLGIASALVAFYGFQHTASEPDGACTEIDMYSEREAACGDTFHDLIADASLAREGLREYLARHVTPSD